jgi:hypothetical protein
LFAYYLESRSTILLLIILAISTVARWEQTACVVFFLLLINKSNPWRKSRWATIGLVVLGITVIYPQVAATIKPIFLGDTVLGGGLMTSLSWLQEHYLFPLALIPKMLMNLFGTLINMFYVKNWDWSDLQNSFIGPISAVLLVALIIALIYSKRLNVHKDLIYYSVLFMVILSASPFLQPRYMYPMYIFACVELSRREASCATQ